MQVLAQALFDVDLNVRQAASQSLSEVKNAASAQILAPYLKHTDTFALSAILRALKPLRPQQLFEEISALVHHEDAFVRREAVSALSWLQQDQAITILAKLPKQIQMMRSAVLQQVVWLIVRVYPQRSSKHFNTL